MEERKVDQLSKLSEFEVDVIQVQSPKTDSAAKALVRLRATSRKMHRSVGSSRICSRYRPTNLYRVFQQS